MARERIRTLKPENWQDEKVGALSRDARLLRDVLITMSDDEGRFRAIPAVIIGFGYCHDPDVTPAKVQRWLAELVRLRMLISYEVDGLPYAAWRKWRDHQRVNKPSRSALAPPPDTDVIRDNSWREGDAEHHLRTLSDLTEHGRITSHSVNGHGNGTERYALEGKGREGSGREQRLSATVAQDDEASTQVQRGRRGRAEITA